MMTLKSIGVAIALTMLASSAIAESWTPPGPIKMLVGFRSGGGADTHASLHDPIAVYP